MSANRQTVYSNSWFRVERVETFFSVVTTDAVAVVARSSAGEWLLVRQYRPSVEGYTWELPAGAIERDETPEVAAVRELVEETGWHLEMPARVTSFYTSVGLTDQQFHVVTGFIDVDATPRSHDREIVEQRWIKEADLVAMVRTGALTTSHTIVPILFLWSSQESNGNFGRRVGGCCVS